MAANGMDSCREACDRQVASDTSLASDDFVWEGTEHLRVLDPAATDDNGFADGSTWGADRLDEIFDRPEQNTDNSLTSLLHVIEEFVDRRAPHAPLESDALLKMKNPNAVGGGFYIELDLPANITRGFVSSESGGRA